MRIRKPTRAGALAIAAALAAFGAFAAPASAAVQNVSVTFGSGDPPATTTVAGETVRYNITFDVPSGLDGSLDQYVDVDASAGATGSAFPPGPPIIVPGGQAYLIQVVAPSEGSLSGPSAPVIRSNSNQTVRVPLGGFEADPGGTLRLTIPGVRSPFTTGMRTLDVSTSDDAAGTSAQYEVVEGPGVVLVESGSEQTAVVGEDFANPLQARVLDGMGNPASGVDVTFTAPASGASGTFADGGGTSDTATTDGSGIATSSTLTANGQVGNWTVTATGPADETPASFTFHNQAGEASEIELQLNPTTIQGDGVSTSTATAHVTDEFGNPISGQTVQITTDGNQGVSAVSSGANGNYSAVVISSPEVDMATITATDATPNPDISDSKTLTQTADLTGPDVLIIHGPKARTTKRNVKFEFERQDPDADSYECRLDQRDWNSCTSPASYDVKIGKHKFKVRATDLAGNTGDPDAYAFKRIRR
jgi:hypothetical protein